MSFLSEGYEVVKNVISQQLLENLKIEFELIKDYQFLISNEIDKYTFGDSQSPNSFSIYSATCFEALALNLNNLMNEITNLTLYPTYSYARIYYKDAILDPHKDRPSCEYSTTICIDSTHIWDFYIKDRNNQKKVITLNPGDMCLYSGCELEHWREPYNGDKQMQCFIHYVNSEGPYKEFKYDKRPMMGFKLPKKLNINHHYK
jgi:hypothetical protein